MVTRYAKCMSTFVYVYRIVKSFLIFSYSFVCTTMQNTRALRLRSYSINTEEHISCTIIEAARATAAAPTFFDPVKISSLGATLYDGALKNNNPIEELVREVEAEFKGQSIGCITSIGTGVSKNEKLGKTLTSIAQACAFIACDTEDTHERFKDRECGVDGRFRGKYFRFNVEQGLQGVGLEEWKAMDSTWEMTYRYMETHKENFSECVRCLKDMDQVAR